MIDEIGMEAAMGLFVIAVFWIWILYEEFFKGKKAIPVEKKEIENDYHELYKS